MKNQILEYKNFKGSVEFDLGSGFIHGKLLFIRDLVTYEADTLPELNRNFIDAVEDYLADCAEDGVEPCKPCSGTLQIRITPETHEQVQSSAYILGQSANAWIGDAIRLKLEGGAVTEVHHHNHEHKHEYVVNSDQENIGGIWGAEKTGHAPDKPRLKIVS